MDNEENILNEFIKRLDEKIDILVNIDNKVDYNSDYDSGYKDAALAIRNTAHTLAKKFSP